MVRIADATYQLKFPHWQPALTANLSKHPLLTLLFPFPLQFLFKTTITLFH
jgi:hypothetical protein